MLKNLFNRYALRGLLHKHLCDEVLGHDGDAVPAPRLETHLKAADVLHCLLNGAEGNEGDVACEHGAEDDA